MFICFFAVVLRWKYRPITSIAGPHPSPKDSRITNGVLFPEYIHVYIKCYIVIPSDDFILKHYIYLMFSEFHYLDSMSPMIAYYWATYPRVIKEPNNVYRILTFYCSVTQITIHTIS